MTAQRTSIVVTGGASGIGLGITKSFAEQGAHISVLDFNPDGQNVVKSLSSEYSNASFSFHKVDVSSWDDMATVFAAVHHEQGRIDVVVANAGISKEPRLIMDEESPSKPALHTLDVNLTGTVYTVKLAIHYIRKNAIINGATKASRGSIICTASNAGIYAFGVAPLYAASKSGVIGFVRGMALQLEKEAIQINALAPAVLETNIAPSKDLFKPMIVTPMETLTRGVHQLVSDTSLTGQIAEIHGQSVTLSQPPPYVDEDTGKNIQTFWNLGYA